MRTVGKNVAAIDTDFFQKSTELDQGEFFLKMMESLDLVPVMHPYVAKVELWNNQKAQALLQSGSILKLEYEDFLEEWELEKYKEDVWQLFELVNEVNLPPVIHRDIYREGFRLSSRNMGEIMTELMAKRLRIPVFMSNDEGAKTIAKRHINSSIYQLEVLNLVDVLKTVGECSNNLKWNEIKKVLNTAGMGSYKDELRSLWVQ